MQCAECCVRVRERRGKGTREGRKIIEIFVLEAKWCIATMSTVQRGRPGSRKNGDNHRKMSFHPVLGSVSTGNMVTIPEFMVSNLVTTFYRASTTHIKAKSSSEARRRKRASIRCALVRTTQTRRRIGQVDFFRMLDAKMLWPIISSITSLICHCLNGKR